MTVKIGQFRCTVDRPEGLFVEYIRDDVIEGSMWSRYGVGTFELDPSDIENDFPVVLFEPQAMN